MSEPVGNASDNRQLTKLNIEFVYDDADFIASCTIGNDWKDTLAKAEYKGAKLSSVSGKSEYGRELISEIITFPPCYKGYLEGRIPYSDIKPILESVIKSFYNALSIKGSQIEQSQNNK